MGWVGTPAASLCQFVALADGHVRYQLSSGLFYLEDEPKAHQVKNKRKKDYQQTGGMVIGITMRGLVGFN